MEEGGFTIVLPSKKGARRYASDGIEAMKVAGKSKTNKSKAKLMRKLSQLKDENEYMDLRKRQKKELFKNDFYKFQIKDVKRQNIEQLQKDFEQDKIRLIKNKRRKLE